MIQNADDKNDLHDFNDLESRDLRDFNRGAVLANIHDKYVIDGNIHNRAMKAWLMDLNAYLSRIPVAEIEGAKESMKLHLKKRDEIDG